MKQYYWFTDGCNNLCLTIKFRVFYFTLYFIFSVVNSVVVLSRNYVML